MKRQSGISLGPGASSLILIFVVLSLSILGILSLMTGRNDRNLSERSVEVIEAVYRLNEQAESTRAEIDTVLAACSQQASNEADRLTAMESLLPEGVTLEEGRICWTETDGTRILVCALEAEPIGSEVRSRWVEHTMVSDIAIDMEDFDE